MKILVIGNGGREHAITWRLSRDAAPHDLFITPGNAGTAALGCNLSIGADDIEGLLAWAVKERPELTIVGPEAPLCAGLVDRFQAAGLPVFGPDRAAAQLEASKVFSKEVMVAAGVPTARSAVFTEVGPAREYLQSETVPIVVKAEGLAAGKGVYVCTTRDQALAAIDDIMVKKIFGAAGARVVVEEFLKGEEASVLAFVDGTRAVLMPAAQDHKRLRNADEGPNTGGMGTYSPAPVLRDEDLPRIEAVVFRPVLAELAKRGIGYRGVLYAGLMMAHDGTPNVLEFNCRFGDPETQVLLPRLKGNFADILLACATTTLAPEAIQWKTDSCVCVVFASGGYPGKYAKGVPIEGLSEAAKLNNVMVFHAGTKQQDGDVVTDGGRVLGVTALGSDIPEAVRRAYLAATRIQFEGMQYRTDIAHRAMKGRI